MSISLSAVILTGGGSARFGSNKSVAMLGGQTLLSRVLTELEENIATVIVGPTFEYPSRAITFTQEDPAGGGPVAAIDAGIGLIETEFVALIATDMPYAAQIIQELTRTVESSRDGLIPLDAEGFPQMLCAIYRTASLRRALAELGNPQGRSMRSLTALLDIEEMELPASLKSRLLDIDTPEDLQKAIAAEKARND